MITEKTSNRLIMYGDDTFDDNDDVMMMMIFIYHDEVCVCHEKSLLHIRRRKARRTLGLAGSGPAL